jgi:hypothetical protein
MILPDYEYCWKFWEEQEVLCLNSHIDFGFSSVDTEIVPIISSTKVDDYYKPIKLNEDPLIYAYYFTHKLSKKEFDIGLKDFAFYLKNEIIKNDFT